MSFDTKNIYLPKYDGSYGDINANLIFSLANTNETQYLCQYEFSSTDYNCDNNRKEVLSSNLQINVPLVLVGDSNPICTRKGDFSSSSLKIFEMYWTAISMPSEPVSLPFILSDANVSICAFTDSIVMFLAYCDCAFTVVEKTNKTIVK